MSVKNRMSRVLLILMVTIMTFFADSDCKSVIYSPSEYYETSPRQV